MALLSQHTGLWKARGVRGAIVTAGEALLVTPTVGVRGNPQTEP